MQRMWPPRAQLAQVLAGKTRAGRSDLQDSAQGRCERSCISCPDSERVSRRAEIWVLASQASKVIFSAPEGQTASKNCHLPWGYLGGLGREVHRGEEGARAELGGKWTQGKDLRWHVSVGGVPGRLLLFFFAVVTWVSSRCDSSWSCTRDSCTFLYICYTLKKGTSYHTVRGPKSMFKVHTYATT